ncbi:MAG: general secretion pathway protein GspE [Sulfurovum sp.]|nr:MAG: general secretion pathway protein GspE [Sulfurovum sp.]
MVTLIDMMLKENIITRSAIASLVKKNLSEKISFINLLDENIVDLASVEIFLVKKIREGKITLSHLEKIEGLDIYSIIQKVAKVLEIESIDLDDIEIDMKLFSQIPYKQLVKYNTIPIEETKLAVKIVFDDPFDMVAQDTMQRLFPNKPIQISIASPKQIQKYLQHLEMNESIKVLVSNIRKELNQATTGGQKKSNSPAVLKLIDIILKSAIYAVASDIHIEATGKSCVIRERVDGFLRQSFILDKDVFNPLVSRIKLLANIDIAEKRKPQDGRFSATLVKKDFDFRVSTLPTIHGESIVLRILDKTKVMLKLEDTGMSKEVYDIFFKAIHVPYGIVLVTGPTGSGKTTTLYGALNIIKNIKDKIITVEDPVEYQITGLQQVQVRSDIGLDFSTILKSILRQDPDKIMVGEIRDKETLRIAIQASLTGHLVLSTLHTNDAISAVNRMLDMGIESYLLSGAVVAVQAQRLVRKICKQCKRKTIPSENLLKQIQSYIPSHATFYVGEGCKACAYSGYAGREMISEVLSISDTFSQLIANNGSKEEMRKQAKKEGFITMFENGIQKVLEGKTTLEEIYRVTKL